MEPPSPENLELLLTKLARLRLKVGDQKRESALWASLPAAEHRQAAWLLQQDRERLAELETLVWLATREKERREAEEAYRLDLAVLGEVLSLAYASEPTNPNPVPNHAQSPSKPDAEK